MQWESEAEQPGFQSLDEMCRLHPESRRQTLHGFQRVDEVHAACDEDIGFGMPTGAGSTGGVPARSSTKLGTLSTP
jgi:hypothetical protein